MEIRAIIFDLGGVLLRTADFSPRERLARRLGMNRLELEELVFGGESGEKAQRGEISVNEHWVNLATQLNCSTQELTLILDEFFAQDQLDDELMGYIRTLHQSYKTALLSNAWDDLRQVIAQKWHFEDAFDTMVISGEVGMTKPDPNIFRLALEKLGVVANEAIFVDDFRRNVEAASLLGMHTVHFQTAEQMRREIEQFINEV